MSVHLAGISSELRSAGDNGNEKEQDRETATRAVWKQKVFQLSDLVYALLVFINNGNKKIIIIQTLREFLRTLSNHT